MGVTGRWFLLTIGLGAAQAAICCWSFSYINVTQKTIRGMVEAFLGAVSGVVIPLLGMAVMEMADATLGAWIFAPTGIVFGWLVASSQSERFPPTQTAETKKIAAAIEELWRVFQSWKISRRQQLKLLWMAVNVAGLVLPVGSAFLDAQAHGYRPWGLPLPLFFGYLAGLGVVQALTASELILFVRMRSKAVRIAVGVTIGLMTAILVTLLGMGFLWLYAFTGFWVFAFSGIIFGWLIASEPIAGASRQQAAGGQHFANHHVTTDFSTSSDPHGLKAAMNSLPADAQASREIHRRLALWWTAVNAAGVTVAVLMLHWDETVNQDRVFFTRSLFLFLLMGLGVLQALAGSALISLVRMRNQLVRTTIGILIGFGVTVIVLLIGASLVWLYIAAALPVFGLSGILFGWLIGRSPIEDGLQRNNSGL